MSYTHIAVALNHAYIYVLISHIYLCKRNMDICVNYEHRNKVNISNQKGILLLKNHISYLYILDLQKIFQNKEEKRL